MPKYIEILTASIVREPPIGPPAQRPYNAKARLLLKKSERASEYHQTIGARRRNGLAQNIWSPLWHRQTNGSQSPKEQARRASGRQLAPLIQREGAVLFEDGAAGQMAVENEVIVDRSVCGGKLLQSLDVPEARHGSFSSSEWLM